MVRPAALLAVCVLAPLAIYAGFNAWLALDRRQANLTEQSIAGVQALVENVDRQIATGLEDADTLAEAPALDPVNGRPANLKVFEEVARRTAQRHPDWLTVTLLAPDGRWIYLSSNSGGGFHIWRQKYPDGVPERITSGPTEQEGTALTPDGKYLITSMGLQQASIWLQEQAAARQLTSEGFTALPTMLPLTVNAPMLSLARMEALWVKVPVLASNACNMPSLAPTYTMGVRATVDAKVA